MKLKICGLKNSQNIEQIVNINPDFIGFIFYNQSPRYAGNELKAPFIRNLKTNFKCGVFVNENLDVIRKIGEEFELDYIQLHGNENPKLCESIRQYFKIIKVFRSDHNFNDINFTDYECADLFLFETSTPNYGGSGKCFEHQLLNDLPIHKDFLVSGGIHHKDFDFAKIKNPHFFGIDVNSRYEIQAGLKDIAQLTLLKTKLENEYA